VKVARSTIAEYIDKSTAIGLSWDQVQGLTEGELERMLFPLLPGPSTANGVRLLPDWAEVNEELRQHRSLTLLRVWEEYRQQHPDGYGYSRFHFHYSRWKKKQGLVMRQQHRAGEKLFIDYCDGPKINSASGQLIETQIFVAVWGVSNYTFVQATLSQDLRNWVKSHVAAFDYFGCVAHILVPDNLKSGVSRACRYEPDLNPTYQDMAIHYGTAVVPARPYKPRDKAKVENGVLLVQRWILAALRKRTFYGVAELNAAMAELLEKLNAKVMRKIGKSRRQMFEALDRPAALPLPVTAYEYATWSKATLGLDYHILADKHHYSVPCQLVGQEVHIRVSANTVEVFHNGVRVASHARSTVIGGTTTDPAHMPRSHREHAGMNLEVARSWAQMTGPATTKLLEKIWQRHNQSVSALGTFRGIYRLAMTYGSDRMECAATRALTYGNYTYASIKRILSCGLDQKSLNNKNGSAEMLPSHENVRGSQYY
jgi:transposase